MLIHTGSIRAHTYYCLVIHELHTSALVNQVLSRRPLWIARCTMMLGRVVHRSRHGPQGLSVPLEARIGISKIRNRTKKLVIKTCDFE